MSVDEATAVELGKPQNDATGAQRPRWGLRIGAAVVALLLVGALATAGVLGWKLHQSNDVDDAARSAQEAARAYAVTLTTVDSGKLSENFDAVIAGATGEFKDMYSQASNQLRQLLLDNNASAQGTVLESGIKSATSETVEVLLYVDQSVTNAANPEPRVDRNRMVMTMQKVDGRWLASKVDLL